MITNKDGSVFLNDELLDCPLPDIFPKLAESINSIFSPSMTARVEDGTLILSREGVEAIFGYGGDIVGVHTMPTVQ